RLRPAEYRQVPIALITITEADIQSLKQWPLSDQQLTDLLQRIKQERPLAIGLDIYRDLPIEPGHAQLRQLFNTTPNLIGIQKNVGNHHNPGVAPPPILRDRGQVGLNDVIVDGDGKIRRNLLSVGEQGQNIPALGVKLALLYLQQQGLTPQEIGSQDLSSFHWISGQASSPCTRLGKATFCRLAANAGGYVRADTGGYQTLSNFLRLAEEVPNFSYRDLMDDRIPAQALKDKIVLIGVKAESVWSDRFYTPYTTDSSSTWAGVEIHANVTAQIITSALEGRPVLQAMSFEIAALWTFIWAIVGIALGWWCHSRRWGLLLIPILLGLLLSVTYGVFLLGWWMVVVSPTLACLGTGLLSHRHWAWQAIQQTNQLLEQKVQARTQELLEKNVALEQARLKVETANRALERLARMDELTQVANRRYFNEYLEQEWWRMMREQTPLSLILIDIDFFKFYNDCYGHPAGDDCLTQVAAVLRSVLKRPTDLVARYGGEEFAVILPNTPIAGAEEIANMMRTTLNQRQIPHERSQVSDVVTMSMGLVCTIPTLQSTPMALLEVTDQLLYQAKKAGRDRIIAETSHLPPLTQGESVLQG
ncbi:MAG: CHASE2 domain-containing protein, partial [Synechococcales bacterium]|nr:CHASE2 domain-containing protein [Synechococcales bacterium]